MKRRSLLPVLAGFAMGPVVFIGPASADAPIVWQGVREIAVGAGVRGPWQQNDSRYDYVDDPTVAVDERGDVFLAWVEQARKDVVFQRLSAGDQHPRRAPVNVSRSPETFSWLPRIALAPQAPHTVCIAWQEIIFSGGSHGGDIVFARSDDGGNSFGAPINLSNSVGGDGKGRIRHDIWDNGSLDIAAGADGQVHVAWTEHGGALWLSRSTDGGRAFTRAQQLAGRGGKPARAPSLALGPDRTVYLAWTVGDDDAADIHIAVSRDGGATFSTPRLVAQTTGHSDAPKVAVDASGKVHLVYAESAGGPFERSHIRYMRSADGGRSFEPAREISKPLPAGHMSAAAPSLAVDMRGRVYVMWELYQRQRQRPRGLGLAVLLDGEPRFGTPIVVPGSADPAGGANGSVQGQLMRKLAVNDAGLIAIVNSSLKDNEHSRVWLIRGQASTARE